MDFLFDGEGETGREVEVRVRDIVEVTRRSRRLELRIRSLLASGVGALGHFDRVGMCFLQPRSVDVLLPPLFPRLLITHFVFPMAPLG